MRKSVAIFIAICLLFVSLPVSSFAAEKDKKKHKTHKQKKAEKRQKKEWRVRSRSNDFREKPGEHVGEHKLEKQTPKEQKKRRKNHLKADGGTY